MPMEMRKLLLAILCLNRELRRAQEEMRRWRAGAYRVSSGLSFSLRQARHNGDCRHERALLESDAVAFEETEIQADLKNLREELMPNLQALPPTLERSALRYRYLEGMSCTQIAQQLHYSRAHVYRMLQAGEKALEEMGR